MIPENVKALLAEADKYHMTTIDDSCGPDSIETKLYNELYQAIIVPMFVDKLSPEAAGYMNFDFFKHDYDFQTDRIDWHLVFANPATVINLNTIYEVNDYLELFERYTHADIEKLLDDNNLSIQHLTFEVHSYRVNFDQPDVKTPAKLDKFSNLHDPMELDSRRSNSWMADEESYALVDNGTDLHEYEYEDNDLAGVIKYLITHYNL